MRVSSQRTNGSNFPYALPFSWFNAQYRKDEDGEAISFEATLSDELLPVQPTANVSETFGNEIWDHILPGLERICITLRSQEYSHAEIAWLLGMKTDEVSRMLYKVKNRLIRIGVARDLPGTKPK